MGTGASKKQVAPAPLLPEHLIRAGGANGDGTLSVEEAKRLLCDVVDQCDADGNGVLDISELAVLLDDPVRVLTAAGAREKGP